MVLTDPQQPDNPLVDVNAAFCALTGYEREDVIGRNCRFLQGPQTSPDAIAALRAAIGREEPIMQEILNYRSDGTPFMVALLLGPIYDDNGTLVHYVGSQLEATSETQKTVRHSMDVSRRFSSLPATTLGGGEDDERTARRIAAVERLGCLSDRERGVLDHLADGLANKEVAAVLSISPRTVEMHRHRLMKKLEVPTLPLALRILFDATS